MELTRPIPPDTTTDKLGRALAGITPGRIFSTLGAVLLVSVGSWWLLRAPAPPVERSLPMAARPSVSTASAAAPPSLVPADVVVQIAGAVVRPGVYHLPLGSRVGDLVAAAGGPIDGVDAAVLPLAAKVTDGQRVYLPKPGEPVSVAAGVSVGGSSGAVAGPGRCRGHGGESRRACAARRASAPASRGRRTRPRSGRTRRRWSRPRRRRTSAAVGVRDGNA